MKKAVTLNRTTSLNFVCAALMLAVLVMLFTPFWNDGEKSTSISAYVWFPSDHGDVEDYFETALGQSVGINDVITAPVLMLFIGAVAIALCLIKVESPFASFLAIPLGAVGVWGYASCAALRLGALWWLHAALCIAALAVSAASIWLGMKNRV